MSRNLLRKLIYSTLLILAVILSYKVYLSFHESDYQGRNYESIKKIEGYEQKDTYSFAVVGSAKNSIDIFQKKIIKEINSDNDIAFVISTGNSVLDGAEDKYQILNNTLKKLRVPSIIGIGNSEISDGGDRRFYRHIGPFYFSFTYGGSYFIFIDTTGKTSFELQKDWISRELANADHYSHKFVFMNSSPLDNKNNDSSNNPYIKNKDFRDFLIDQFSLHEVTGVFMNGSAYKKSEVKNIAYYSSGGAGGLFLNNSSNYKYHYLKVDVSSGGIAVKSIEEPLVTKIIFLQKIERIWIYIHSIFYAQFVNISLAICLVLLVFMLMYAKASKDVNYYRNYSTANKEIDTNMKLNIAMFTNNYFPFVGGVPISINRLAEALRKRGNHVTIFAPDYPDKIENETNVFRCKLLFYRKTGNFNFAIANIFLKKIDKEFYKNNFDIVHVHHPFWMGTKGLSLAKESNIPAVLTYHTRLEMYAENLPFFKLAFKNIFSHRIVRDFSQKCEGIIAPTVSAKQYLENVGVSRRKLVVPTGIDFKQYEDADEDSVEKIRNTYAPNGEVLLCSVSRLSVEKNINFLIKGLKYVKDNTKVNFQCLLIGDGPERANLQKLIEECSLNNEITLLGSIQQKEIAQYYLASDLFVFSSLSETQGMVLLEAMAGKCPVICIRSSGTDDVIRDGYNGYKTSDIIPEWSEKVIYLLENRDILSTMSKNAFSHALKFTEDKMAETIEMFYKKLIAIRSNNMMENNNDKKSI